MCDTVDNPVCHLDKLDDSILLAIFDHLDIHHRLRLEKVAKRWARLLPCWANKFTYIQFECVVGKKATKQVKPLDAFPEVISAKCPLVYFVPLIRRAGKTLKRLNILAKRDIATILGLVDSQCPQLSRLELNIVDGSLGLKEMPALVPLGPRLRNLQLGFGADAQEPTSAEVLGKTVTFLEKFFVSSQLESFTVDAEQGYFCSALLALLPKLPKTLGILQLDLQCCVLKQNELMDFLSTHPDLRELALGLRIEFEAALGGGTALLGTMPRHLEILSMHGGRGGELGNPDLMKWHGLGDLKCLRDLSVCSFDSFDRAALAHICAQCPQLEALDVSRCNLGLEALQPVTKLTKLTKIGFGISDMTVQNLAHFTKHFPQLVEIVELDGCTVQAPYMVALAENCPRLERLHVDMMVHNQHRLTLGLAHFLKALMATEWRSRDKRPCSIIACGQEAFTYQDCQRTFKWLEKRVNRLIQG